MYRLDSLMEMKREAFEEIFRVNLLSDFLVNRTFLPFLHHHQRAGAAGSAFLEKTKLYPCNARRFHRIVDRVEARSILPEKIGKKALEILRKKHPAFAYGINRNPLLRILDLCPKRLQLFAIRQALKQEK